MSTHANHASITGKGAGKTGRWASPVRDRTWRQAGPGKEHNTAQLGVRQTPCPRPVL